MPPGKTIGSVRFLVSRESLNDSLPTEPAEPLGSSAAARGESPDREDESPVQEDELADREDESPVQEDELPNQENELREQEDEQSAEDVSQED